MRFYYLVTDDGGVYVTEKKPSGKEINDEFIAKHCVYFGSANPKNSVDANLFSNQKQGYLGFGSGTSIFNSEIFSTPDEIREFKLTGGAKEQEK